MFNSKAMNLLHKTMGDKVPRYWHSLGVAKLVEELLIRSGKFSEDCVNAAILHDIGYADKANKVGFHPVDGYRFLKERGWSDAVCQLTLYHSLAHSDYMYNHKNKKLSDYVGVSISDGVKYYLDILSYADWHTDGQGNLVSVDYRYADILSRHGEESKVWSFMQSIRPEIDKICDRVEKELGATYEILN